MLTEREIQFEAIKSTVQDLQSKTIQLFRQDPVKGIRSHGCGILFTYNFEYFILTAYHNLADEDFDTITARVGPHLPRLRPCVVKYSKVVGTPSLDKIDIAVIHLQSSELIAMLHQYNSFTHLSDIRLDLQNINKKVDKFSLFGYPGSKTKPKYNVDREYTISALYTEVRPANKIHGKLKEHGFSAHIIFDKPKKGYNYFTNQQITSPQMKGLSGCGLWILTSLDVEKLRYNSKLVGIFTELHFGQGFATRIDFVTELMRAHFGTYTMPGSHFVREWKGKYGTQHRL